MRVYMDDHDAYKIDDLCVLEAVIIGGLLYNNKIIDLC